MADNTNISIDWNCLGENGITPSLYSHLELVGCNDDDGYITAIYDSAAIDFIGIYGFRVDVSHYIAVHDFPKGLSSADKVKAVIEAETVAAKLGLPITNKLIINA